MTKLLLRLFVKNSENPSDPAVRRHIGSMSGLVGIFCNVLLFAMKLLAALLAGSVSIMADALNNLSDASGSIVTLIGFRLADKPADEHHPYGHARFEYLSALAVSAMILIIGVELGKSSVEKILHPESTVFSLAVLIVLVGSIAVKLWLSLFNRKLGDMICSGALRATAADSRNDCITTLAVLIASLAEYFFQVRLDGWIGLGVAIFILISGINLARDTISPLLGESADPEMKRELSDYISGQTGVLGFHDLMVHDYGPGQRFASLHVEMDRSEDPLVCHERIDDMERYCLQQMNIHLVIHYDPVVTDDPALDRMRQIVTAILQVRDERLSIHDFRMVPGEGHTNLIFDVTMPQELRGQEEQIRPALEKALNDLGDSTTYFTVITFDLMDFN